MAYKTPICPVCGNSFIQNKTGRPRQYHPNCRKLEQLFSWTEEIISSDLDLTVDAKKRIRSRLWYLANLLNAK